MTSDFSHPCKEACSGWKQGYEAGLTESRKENEALMELLERADFIISSTVLISPVERNRDEWIRDYNALMEKKDE